MKKSSCGELCKHCLICNEIIPNHRVMKINILHSVDESKETKLASLKYSIPLCDKHNGRGSDQQQIRVKLSWESDEIKPDA